MPKAYDRPEADSQSTSGKWPFGELKHRQIVFLYLQLLLRMSAMNPIHWLEQNAPGFDALSNREREAIAHFTLLWSFFEARALLKHATPKRLIELTHSWSRQGHLSTQSFAGSLLYFQDRYYANGSETQNFSGLNLRPNDYPDLVRCVLNGQNTSSVDCVAVLLIVVYRIRSNLFHGEKWAYGVQGQLKNFTHANTTLLKALSIVGLP